MAEPKDITYFYGCPTQDGFLEEMTSELFSEGLYTYIIKGGPGTGKSSLMRKVANEFKNCERFVCSSDPDSLDAVLLREKGIAFVDGTAPHVADPKYPGVMQKIIDLGAFWDDEKLLENKEKIISLTDENQKLHQRVKRYLRAAGGIFGDVINIGEGAILGAKLEAFCRRFSNRLLQKKNKEGRLSKRRITSITPKGLMTLTNVFDGMKVYYIDDPIYACADRILKRISSIALSKGYDVIVSTSVFSPESVYEHVIIPEISVALTSKKLDGAAKINAMRFYDGETLREKKKRLRFSLNVLKELVLQTVSILESAKKVHDSLEKCYVEAMDFEKAEAFTISLIKNLK